VHRGILYSSSGGQKKKRTGVRLFGRDRIAVRRF
jgi:hypothetical protein